MEKKEVDLEELTAGIDQLEGDVGEQIGEVHDDSEEIKTPEQPYIKLHTADFIFVLKLFASMNRSLRDILSRAAFIKVIKSDAGGNITVCMTDGVFFGKVDLPYQEISSDFPEEFVLDYDSLTKVASMAGKSIYLVCEDGHYYIDFFGGRVHMPSFNLDFTHLTKQSEKLGSLKGNPVELPAPNFLRNLSIAHEYLTSSQLPNLSFMFVKEGDVYLSNGYTVMRLKAELDFTSAVRKVDLPFMTAATKIALKSGLELDMGDNRLSVFSDDVAVSIPKVNEELPGSYVQKISEFDKVKSSHFAVDFAKFYLLLSLLSKVYRASGVVTLKAEGDSLTLRSKSLDDEESFMVLSRSKVGQLEDCELSFSVAGLLSVLKSLKAFSYLNLTIKGNSFCLFNDLVTIVVFGTGTSAKTDTFKLKKAGNRRSKQSEGKK